MKFSEIVAVVSYCVGSWLAGLRVCVRELRALWAQWLKVWCCVCVCVWVGGCVHHVCATALHRVLAEFLAFHLMIHLRALALSLLFSLCVCFRRHASSCAA